MTLAYKSVSVAIVFGEGNQSVSVTDNRMAINEFNGGLDQEIISMRPLSIAACLMLVSSGASAEFSKWFVEAEWEDIGDGFASTISGSFEYDPVLDVYDNVNITVIDPSLLSSCPGGFCSIAVEFTTDNISIFTSSTALDLIAGYFPGSTEDLTDRKNLSLVWSDDFSLDLDTDLDPIDLPPTASFYGTCTNPECTTLVSSAIITSGTVSLTEIPLPAAAWLFGSAVAGLGWARRKQYR